MGGKGAMTRPDTVLTAMFHEDWLKYFKPLHTPAVGAVREKPEKRAAVVRGGSTERVAFTEP